MASNDVDAIVVGAGAGGGVVAKELAAAGLRVVLFDRGRHFSTADFGHDELADSQEPWNRTGLRFGPGPTELRTYRSDPGLPARVVTPRDYEYSSLAWCVGGGTLSYQALAWRFSPRYVSTQVALRRDSQVHRRGLSSHIRRARAVLHQGRARARRLR